MSVLVEVVFESVGAAAASALTRDLIVLSAGVRDCWIDGESVSSDTGHDQLLLTADYSAGINLTAIRVGHLEIPNVSIRVLRSGDELFDVEFNVDLDDIEEPSAFQTALHGLAGDLARRHEVAHYFAGLEPASDDDERLFTGQRLGPLRL